MILSRPDILTYLKEGKLRIEPKISPEQIAQVSIDLRLGRKFTVFKKPPPYLSAIKIDPSLWTSVDLWEHYEQSSFRLDPGQFVLAQTLERIRIPPDLVGLVEGRSSWARVGITIHVTAPKIDPGFDAPITLEMANFGRVSVELQAEVDKPAQLMLLRLTTPVSEEELYGTGAHDTFQGQTDPIPYKRSELCPDAPQTPQGMSHTGSLFRKCKSYKTFETKASLFQKSKSKAGRIVESPHIGQ